MSVSGSGSLRDRQVEALKNMLTLDGGGSGINGVSEPTWKVLVYDKTGQDILGPILSVKELRDLGVTLHLMLHSHRDTIPDAPCVYFCLPTEDNLRRLGQDLDSHLYGSYYYNFISPISRMKLEDLATSALQAGCDDLIQRLFDQYTNFICLESDMFCLKQPSDESLSYLSMNRGGVGDTEMEEMLSNITDSLFSLCVTLGTVPIIRCPGGNAAAAVAERLDKKLRENLRDARNSLFSDSAVSGRYSFHRPVLILVDRDCDMATSLHHTWTYQALAHDVLPYTQNRVTVPGAPKGEQGMGNKSKDKVYDLDPKDEFWIQHKGSPFPQVAEAIQEALEEIKGKEEEIKKMKADMGLAGGDMDDALSNLNLNDNTAKLTSAVSSLPALLEKKRLIDMHCSLATAVLDFIKQRRLDVFFELEEKMMSASALDKSIMDVLSDPDNGTPDDKLRLFLIFYLTSPTISDAEFDQYAGALRQSGCDLAPLTFLKQWKSYTMQGSRSYGSEGTNQGAGGAGGQIKAVSMFSNLISQSSNFVMAGVKNLVVKKHNLPLTKIVDDIMDQKQGKYNDEYKYLDPKNLRANEGAQMARTKTPFSDAIVFVVGGGNYIEYQNLQDYVKAKNTNTGFSSNSLSALGTGKRVVYGSTQLLNADQFLDQLKKLGRERSGE